MTGKFFESMNNKKYHFNNFKLINYFLFNWYIHIHNINWNLLWNAM